MNRALSWALLVVIAACGGRTNIGDDDLVGDANTPLDGSIIVPKDSGIVIQDGGIIIEDGGVIIEDASVPPSDASGGSIACGNATCNANVDVCCVMFQNQMESESCVAKGQCQGGAALDCTSAASCPANEVCCASFTQQNIGSSCESQCAGGFQNPQLCAQSSECPKGQTCMNGPFGFKICRP
jgi:hypothetical protein